MYEAPVTIYETAMRTIMEEREGAILAKIQSAFDVDVDKAELLRALQYDRDQYDKGYADGKADAMARRCVDGKSVAMDLKDTVDAMCSDDYKARFMAEYYQTKIRYEKLKKFNTKIEAADRVCCFGEKQKIEAPKHDCPIELLTEQQNLMGRYLHILEVRAEIEGIDL